MNLAGLNAKIDAVLKSLSTLEKRQEHISRLLARDFPATQNKQKPTNPQQSRSRFNQFLNHPLPRSVWAAIAVILAIAGGFSSYAALRYDVSISTLTSLNPSAPFETRFLVTNDAPFLIFDVVYYCVSSKVHVNAGGESSYGTFVPTPVGELRPHSAYSIRCQHQLGDAHIDSGALFEIHVRYTPKFFPWLRREGGQQFVLKYDNQGNTVWLPTALLTKDANELRNEVVNP